MIPTADQWRQMPLWSKALFLMAAATGFTVALAIELLTCSGRP